MSQPAIRTNGLTKRYGSVRAIDGLELTVERGEVYGFLGPNGAGKSTTIDVLLDIVRPTAGSATVLGLDAREDRAAVHDRIGVLPEDFDFYDRLSGLKHLRFAADLKGADEDPLALVDRVGLDREDAERAVGEYSQGMRKRLGLAIALIGEPDLLILDEPTNGLDPNGAREMRELVRAENERGATVFFSSHVMSQVQAICDRVGIMNDGRLVAEDTIEGLRSTVGGGATLTFEFDQPPAPAEVDLAGEEAVREVTAGEGSLSVTCTEPAAKFRVIDAVQATGAEPRDLHVEESSLEDLFAAYTVDDGGPAGEEAPAASNGARDAVEVEP